MERWEGDACLSTMYNPCLAVNHAVLQSFHYRETALKTQTAFSCLLVDF